MKLERTTLTGTHVRLSPLRLEHAASLVEAATESRRTYGFTLVPSDLVGMQTYIAKALSEEDAGRALPFAVEDADGRLVGSTRFLDVDVWEWLGAPLPPIPSGPDGVEIGYTWYAERAQRTALNTEAKLLLCTLAFERWGVRRVTWKTDARNERSRTAIMRLGARFDGVLRANRAGADGQVRDTAFFSMLASEWPAARAALQRRLNVPETRGSQAQATRA